MKSRLIIDQPMQYHGFIKLGTYMGKSNENHADILVMLNRYVKKWLDANKLALNLDKTNFVLFHFP